MADGLAATPRAADDSGIVERAVLWALLAAKLLAGWGVQWDGYLARSVALRPIVPGALETQLALAITVAAAAVGGHVATGALERPDAVTI